MTRGTLWSEWGRLPSIYSALRENRPYNRPMNCVAALGRMSEKSSRIDMDLFKVFAELALSNDSDLGRTEPPASTERRLMTLL